MTRPAHGRSLGVTDARLRDQLRTALLRLYDADEAFGDALMDLIPLAQATGLPDRPPEWKGRAGLWTIASHALDREDGRRPAKIAEWIAFVRAVDALAAEFGLDRLGDPALDHIFTWCDMYLRARRSGSLHPSTYGRGRLSTASPHVFLAPEVDTRIGPPWWTETWDPARETRREATVRLEAIAKERIRKQLDRDEAGAVAAGLTFPDTTPNRQRDLGWLFRRLRHRESFQAIYDSIDPPPEYGAETVRGAVLRIARKVGVDTRGWETGWR